MTNGNEIIGQEDRSKVSGEEEPVSEFKINYVKHNLWIHGAKKDETPPQGWFSEEEVIERSGMTIEKFDQMIRSRDGSSKDETRGRYIIDGKWLEFYKVDSRLAVNYLLTRFISNPEPDIRQLEHNLSRTFIGENFTASPKQLQVLKNLLLNQYLTPGERWLLELLITDGWVTKAEAMRLLDYFWGESYWDGSKYQKSSYGVLSERKRAAKIYPAEAF